MCTCIFFKHIFLLLFCFYLHLCYFICIGKLFVKSSQLNSVEIEQAGGCEGHPIPAMHGGPKTSLQM